MHQRRRLLLDRADQTGMAVAQDVERDAACEIQKTLAALVDQIATVAAHGPYVAPGIDGQKRRDRHHVPPERGWITETQKGDPFRPPVWTGLLPTSGPALKH